ncbi:MAG TPA: DUF3179 domain-containing protein [Acidimicrobiia bacterium]|nr:DUF3179 domain-containing protein [Acidimicrobiia bacterium]
MRSRLPIAVAALALLTAACGVGGESIDAAGDGVGATSTTAQSTTPSVTIDPEAEVASALRDMRDPSFPPPLVDPAEIISGGPPPDGIPPIDDPQFITVWEADEWLDEAEPVVYLEINGEVHAYPAQIMIWHEIVNDTVGGVPVTVTYCPLCNSAVSYHREVAGEVTTFGTSGRLFASALVMYDRLTESLWTHFDGRAVVGALTGAALEPIPSPLLAWSDFKKAFPEAMVLDRSATGFSRPYGENPYFGYDDETTTPFLFRGTVDDRAAAKQRVVGVVIDDLARAFSLDFLSVGEASATNTEVGETPIVILWKAGQASALDETEISDGRDVGSAAVFSPLVDGERLTFVADSGEFRDEQTASLWDITGTAVSGELAGTTLEQIHHLDTFWFAWSTYQPDTDLVDG